MFPVLGLAAVVFYAVFFGPGCEGRPKSLPDDAESKPDTGVKPGKDGGMPTSDANDAGAADALGRADVYDAATADASARADTYDAGAADVSRADVSRQGDADHADVYDAATADASARADTYDAGVGVLACNDLRVSLDEFSCVTDPRSSSVFGSELPRSIKMIGFAYGSPDLVGCPSRDVMLHEWNRPLFISLMADRASIPTLQLNPDARLSQFAEDFISSVNGVHNFVPADGFIDGAVGVWRADSNPGSGRFIFDAAIEGLNLTYSMPGYSCNYQVSSPW